MEKYFKDKEQRKKKEINAVKILCTPIAWLLKIRYTPEAEILQTENEPSLIRFCINFSSMKHEWNIKHGSSKDLTEIMAIIQVGDREG